MGRRRYPRPSMLIIEILCTGDEVLSGKIVNANFAYLAQKLEDHGFAVRYGTVVGDVPEDLLQAFQKAAARADAVIVNGGLGPTVDDLSQEIAARAAGVELVLNEEWLARMRQFFRSVGRTMPKNNRKQALIPAGAEVLDNPIGTACGFAMQIDSTERPNSTNHAHTTREAHATHKTRRAQFFFTPGVPRELYRMTEEQILPRLKALSGAERVIRLKRFHTYGLGESHVDELLRGVERLAPQESVKLGFRAHYPQLETKLTVHAASSAEADAYLAPVTEAIEGLLGNFIVAQDDETHEGNVLRALRTAGKRLAVLEDLTAGALFARLGDQLGSERATRSEPPAEEVEVLSQGWILPRTAEKAAFLKLSEASLLRHRAADDLPHYDDTEALAARLREQTQPTTANVPESDPESDGATLDPLALVLQVGLTPVRRRSSRATHDAVICLALAEEQGIVSRRARITGTWRWIRDGAVEMGLDCLRRHLNGLPLKEEIDFERPQKHHR